MAADIRIATASPADAAAVAAIYAHHVIHGTASFDTRPPGADETAALIERVLAAGWPFLVAREPGEPGDPGEVVGYAYATQFRDRAAYRYTCENSIYIRHDRRGQGIGRALLALLIVGAERYGFRQMIAVIGGAERASERLHAACGFRESGRMRSVGRKHGAWLDTLYMQRTLGRGDALPPPAEPE